MLGPHVVPEAFLSVQLRLGLGQLAVQPRQLLLLGLDQMDGYQMDGSDGWNEKKHQVRQARETKNRAASVSVTVTVMC